MATAANELVPMKRGRVRKDGKPDGRRNNGGARPNSGPDKWQAEPQMIEDRQGVVRMEKPDEALNRVKSLVRHYVAIGYPAENICKLLDPPMSEATLKRHFQHELTHGRLIQDAKVAGTLYQLAVSGRDPATSRFWARVRLGWHDRPDQIPGGTEVTYRKIDGDDW